ncbi:monocarboxylate transporter [Pseudozyma hubeiensis SY62]|uniref:Monocarboxylate transporter n=1 Tax=Pseudozyma hubeiensis (strain SY62) TaxID=1305764 RepID=R9P274_PSEHS|nr:monocarboxylate transporter [Pseudozyma hubeiensis SY62]GAC95473.1 monocarboxylate transporter [Pseudozyma hubeiensis SY62]
MREKLRAERDQSRPASFDTVDEGSTDRANMTTSPDDPADEPAGSLRMHRLLLVRQIDTAEYMSLHSVTCQKRRQLNVGTYSRWIADRGKRFIVCIQIFS